MVREMQQQQQQQEQQQQLGSPNGSELEIHVDASSGRRYSYNRTNGETQWEDASPEFSRRHSTLPADSPRTARTSNHRRVVTTAGFMPTELQVHVDASSGRRYSYNPANGDTKWEDTEIETAAGKPLPRTENQNQNQTSSAVSQLIRRHGTLPTNSSPAARTSNHHRAATTMGFNPAELQVHVDESSGRRYSYNPANGDTKWEETETATVVPPAASYNSSRTSNSRQHHRAATTISNSWNSTSATAKAPPPTHGPTDSFAHFQDWAQERTRELDRNIEESEDYDEANSHDYYDDDDYDPDDPNDPDDYDPDDPDDPFDDASNRNNRTYVAGMSPPPPLPPPPGPPPLPYHQQTHHYVDHTQTNNIMHQARSVRVSRLESKNAKNIENAQDLHRRYSLINVLDPSNMNAREEQQSQGSSYGVVLPPSGWGDGTNVVRVQQRRHDHLRPITGAPAINGVFLGAANFIEHVDLGYANVAGAPPTKVKGETYSTGLPSDMPWGIAMAEDENRKGVIVVLGIADNSPGFHMDIRPGDRLLGVEGNFFKSTIDMGMVTQAISTFKRQRAETGGLVELTFAREPEELQQKSAAENSALHGKYFFLLSLFFITVISRASSSVLQFLTNYEYNICSVFFVDIFSWLHLVSFELQVLVQISSILPKCSSTQ